MEQSSTTIVRLARLIQGQCPIHGVSMLAAHTDSPLRINIMCCPQFDCAVTVHNFPDGTFELPQELAYLLSKQQ